jgi:hypothetical protein
MSWKPVSRTGEAVMKRTMCLLLAAVFSSPVVAEEPAKEKKTESKKTKAAK